MRFLRNLAREHDVQRPLEFRFTSERPEQAPQPYLNVINASETVVLAPYQPENFVLVPCVLNTVFARCDRERDDCYGFAHGVASVW
jgi:hypothetical protein